jgi:hypothetical protein
MQEANGDLAALPKLVGGHFVREPLDGRVYGLVAWSPESFPPHLATPARLDEAGSRTAARGAAYSLRGCEFRKCTFIARAIGESPPVAAYWARSKDPRRLSAITTRSGRSPWRDSGTSGRGTGRSAPETSSRCVSIAVWRGGWSARMRRCSTALGHHPIIYRFTCSRRGGRRRRPANLLPPSSEYEFRPSPPSGKRGTR